MEASEGRSPDAERPDTGFLIDGKRYPVPLVESITLDEERVLYLYAGVILEDFAPVHPDLRDDERASYVNEQSRKIGSPEFKRAWAIIAYRRDNPDATSAEMEEAVGKANALQITLSLLGDDVDPPTSSQNEPSRTSETSPPENRTGSGRTSEGDSAPVEWTLEPIGTSGSDTSTPGAPPIELVK